MPWSVRTVRTGRDWVTAPDAASLRSRWAALLRASGAGREALFAPTRARTTRTAVPRLPGTAADAPAVRLDREDGPCPEPVRVLCGPYDRQWLIPDHRLLDAARPELWRVADDRQILLVEPPAGPRSPVPEPVFTELLPVGAAASRTGRVRPLYRRPGGREPNLAPGLPGLLAGVLGTPVTAEDVLAWTAAAARTVPGGRAVPLTADREVWEEGVALGREVLRAHTRGARCGDGTRPRLPGGRRPYVRGALPEHPAPDALRHDAREEILWVGGGRIAPVARGAWEFEAGGVRVLADWFARRTAPAAPGTLEAVRPNAWPAGWTSELLELITVLTLLGGLREARAEFAERRGGSPVVGVSALREAGVLPAPPGARRPASVLDHREEGPEGQLTLL
ncbi:type ISP restriction/modification enzyme [Streptomyces sp. CNQ085]|uniref:type ISP restriction/modification enzyme n=1 Tax=Streptomyces sp. CNQ085 TaxID=2886944 RepID=UPI001F50E96F|nr:type ISP restriction/modification enzyme [Streptomyces sp. CNQ085]MCI0384818.1 DNA methyltransferase [Streptomyces sp. CNQ085]